MFARPAIVLIVCLLTAAAARSEDNQIKAEKEVRKITAMAADASARPLVSQAVAEYLNDSPGAGAAAAGGEPQLRQFVCCLPA
jgi:hypothetical protein